MKAKKIAAAFAAAMMAATAAAQHDHHPQAKETAFGRPADPATAQRTVRVEMRDSNRFSPAEITVRQGEIVRFVAVNAGRDPHEMVLGTMQDLEEHAALMKRGTAHHHAGPHLTVADPGQSGVIGWQFTKAGEFYYGCLVDDHFERGMVGRIRVVAAERSEEGHGEHAHAEAPAMHGALGAYPMTREASGTSWQPDAAPHQGVYSTRGDWSLMTHGFVNLIYDRQGGPRGDSKLFSTSMLMLMAQRPAAGGTLGLRGMISADPLMGKRGYPLLFQTGESANGEPLIDRQHPHDLFMELAASYSLSFSEGRSVFVYAGLPGEPALGPPAFMHRFSGEENPEAPISHHWLDSTHIAYGVVTLGYMHGPVKLEASAFRGREPDENRYDIETGRLDSASVRLSVNPTPNWAFQLSRGRIKSPEELHADEDVVRTTASAIYHRGAMQTTLAWGRNESGHHSTDTLLLESALRLARNHMVFARAERADKNELFREGHPLDHETFTVGKLSVGYLYDLPREGRMRLGVGGLVSRYSLPGTLKPFYGNPTSFMVFMRARI